VRPSRYEMFCQLSSPISIAKSLFNVEQWCSESKHTQNILVLVSSLLLCVCVSPIIEIMTNRTVLTLYIKREKRGTSPLMILKKSRG